MTITKKENSYFLNNFFNIKYEQFAFENLQCIGLTLFQTDIMKQINASTLIIYRDKLFIFNI